MNLIFTNAATAIFLAFSCGGATLAGFGASIDNSMMIKVGLELVVVGAIGHMGREMRETQSSEKEHKSE